MDYFHWGFGRKEKLNLIHHLVLRRENPIIDSKWRITIIFFYKPLFQNTFAELQTASGIIRPTSAILFLVAFDLSEAEPGGFRFKNDESERRWLFRRMFFCTGTAPESTASNRITSNDGFCRNLNFHWRDGVQKLSFSFRTFLLFFFLLSCGLCKTEVSFCKFRCGFVEAAVAPALVPACDVFSFSFGSKRAKGCSGEAI